MIDAANASIESASDALAGAVQATMMEGRGTDDASDSARTADVTGSGRSIRCANSRTRCRTGG